MRRFARSLGFSSYPALRVNIQTSLRQRVTHSSRIKSRLEDMRSSADIFERLAASEIDYLSQALETVNREQMERAVDFLRERKRVFVDVRIRQPDVVIRVNDVALQNKITIHHDNARFNPAGFGGIVKIIGKPGGR